MLCGEADARAYRAVAAASVAQALELIRRESFDALLVDLAPGAESAFALLTELKRLSSETEVIVMSERTSMAAAIQWFDPDAFLLVRKSDVGQLFAALGRALERRRITMQNRRLVWELQTINEIASGIATFVVRDRRLVLLANREDRPTHTMHLATVGGRRQTTAARRPSEGDDLEVF